MYFRTILFFEREVLYCIEEKNKVNWYLQPDLVWFQIVIFSSLWFQIVSFSSSDFKSLFSSHLKARLALELNYGNSLFQFCVKSLSKETIYNILQWPVTIVTQNDPNPYIYYYWYDNIFKYLGHFGQWLLLAPVHWYQMALQLKLN